MPPFLHTAFLILFFYAALFFRHSFAYHPFPYRPFQEWTAAGLPLLSVFVIPPSLRPDNDNFTAAQQTTYTKAFLLLRKFSPLWGRPQRRLRGAAGGPRGEVWMMAERLYVGMAFPHNSHFNSPQRRVQKTTAALRLCARPERRKEEKYKSRQIKRIYFERKNTTRKTGCAAKRRSPSFKKYSQQRQQIHCGQTRLAVICPQ